MAQEADRRATLDNLLGRVEDELDRLSEQLSTTLDAYDAEIERAAHGLPSWIALPASQLRGELRFDDASPFASAMLGPHAAAIAAGEVDQFITRWLGCQGQLAGVDLERDAQQLSRYREDVTRVEEFMLELGGAARALGARARDTFHVWRETILTELEEQRREEAELVESFVSRGTLEAGRDAKLEIAQLWEEQRLKVDHLQNSWRAVTALTRHGEKHTMEGIASLTELLHLVCMELERAHLGETIAPPKPLAMDPDIGLDPDFSFEDAGPTLPPGQLMAPGPMLSFEDSEPELELVDDAGPTLPPKELLLIAPTSYDDDEGFDPYSSTDGPGFALTAEEPVSFHPLDEQDEGLDTLLLHPGDGEGADEAALGGPMIDFDEEEDPADPANDFITRAIEDGAGLDERSSAPDEETDDTPEATPEVDPGATETSPAGEPTEAPANTDDEAANADEEPDLARPSTAAVILEDNKEDMPPAELVCFRSRDGLVPVRGGEAALLAVPLVLSALVSGVSLYAVTQGVGVNLLAQLPQAPLVVLGLLVWSLIFPFARRWRVLWRGFSPKVWRQSRIDDEADFTWDRRGFELGPWIVRWAEIEEVSRERWQSGPDHTRGWLLSVRVRRGEPLVLISESEDDSWEMTTLPIVQAPDDAWQINEKGFDAFKIRCIRAMSARQRGQVSR